MPPMTLPLTTMGVPPWLGSTCPGSTPGTMAQNMPPFCARSASTAVEARKLAAAVALAREVSGLRKLVPSPRAERTRRPASSTTVTVMGVPSAFALSWAARTARSAIASVISIMSVLSRLPALEVGRALVHEGPDALARVLGLEADVLSKGLELEPAPEIGALAVIERALGEPDGDGRSRGDLPGQVVRRGHELLGRIHRAHQPDPQRLGGVDH